MKMRSIKPINSFKSVQVRFHWQVASGLKGKNTYFHSFLNFRIVSKRVGVFNQKDTCYREKRVDSESCSKFKDVSEWKNHTASTSQCIDL